MRSVLFLLALLAVFPAIAAAQDKRLEAVCGQLFGARQTALRLLKEGWQPSVIVQDALNRLQETLDDPRSPSSPVIRDCMQRATAAPKSG